MLAHHCNCWTRHRGNTGKFRYCRRSGPISTAALATTLVSALGSALVTISASVSRAILVSALGSIPVSCSVSGAILGPVLVTTAIVS